MDERDFQAMQSVVWAKGELQPEAHSASNQPKLAASVEEIIDYFKGEIAKPAHAPSWYDIYRYATDESKWYEKERTRLVSDGAKLDAIEEVVRQANFFNNIMELADIQMMNACLQTAKANGIENPFQDFHIQSEKQ